MCHDGLQCSKIEITRVKKRQRLSDNHVKLIGEYITIIKHTPMKSLGKRFDHSLMDAVAIQKTRDCGEVVKQNF